MAAGFRGGGTAALFLKGPFISARGGPKSSAELLFFRTRGRNGAAPSYVQRHDISGASIPGGSDSRNDCRAFEHGVHCGRSESHLSFLLGRNATGEHVREGQLSATECLLLLISRREGTSCQRTCADTDGRPCCAGGPSSAAPSCRPPRLLRPQPHWTTTMGRVCPATSRAAGGRRRRTLACLHGPSQRLAALLAAQA